MQLINLKITVFACIAFFISYFQFFGISPDFTDYDFFLYFARLDGWQTLESSRFEKGFVVLAVLLTSFFSSNLVVYSVIVALSIYIKAIVFNHISKNSYIFVFVAAFYFPCYFILHELTQIRIACAISILMLASAFMWSHYRIYGILGCIIAFLFHTSTIAFIPSLLFQVKNRLNIIIVGICTFIGVFMTAHFLPNYLEKYIPTLTMYQESGFGDIAPNPFSGALLLDWTLIIVSLVVLWDQCSVLMRRIIFLEVLGMATFYGLLEIPVVAHRLREIFSVFWIFFVAEGIKKESTGIPIYIYVFVSSLWQIYITIDRGFFK